MREDREERHGSDVFVEMCGCIDKAQNAAEGPSREANNNNFKYW